MRYRRVGASDLTVSVVGLGCIHFGRTVDEAQARAVVDAAIDVGITLFDTAYSYGDGASERFLGAALKGRRDRAVISTKFGSKRLRAPGQADGSRRSIRQAVDEALQRLDTDHIDLLQLHHPDPLTPLDETLAALDEVVREGKVRHIGTSNLPVADMVEADRIALARTAARFVAAQREYGLLARAAEADVVPACVRLGIGLLAYRPLANGLLTGRYKRDGADLERTARERGATDATFAQLETLERFACERGISLLDLGIGGILARPAVSAALVGARHPEQVTANARASEWIPTAAENGAVEKFLS